MRIDTLVIGILICAAVLVTSTMIFNDQIEGYGINVTNKQFETAETYINETEETIMDMKEAMKPSGIGVVDALNFFIAAAGNALTLAWTTLLLPQKIIFEFVSVFQLPPIVGTILVTIIMVSIIFGLIYLFFRFKPPRD